MATIGDFPMPEDFRYKDVYLKGKPQHSKTDPFRLRHPSMDVRKRAKIFAPFNALKGYNEAVAAKNVLYEDKRELNEEIRMSSTGGLVSCIISHTTAGWPGQTT